MLSPLNNRHSKMLSSWPIRMKKFVKKTIKYGRHERGVVVDAAVTVTQTWLSLRLSVLIQFLELVELSLNGTDGEDNIGKDCCQ